MEATGAVLGTATGAFELLDRVELYVNRYFERRDLAEDSVALHLRLLEEHRTALQLIEMTERQSNFDREPVCNQFIRSRLHVIRSRLEHNNNDLNALNSTLSNAGATRRVRRANARLKNHEKDITEFYSFVNDTVIPALRENSPAIQTPSVSYTTSSNVPPNPPRLTLQYENEDTCEGELKAAILEGSGSTVVGVVASGLGGVGKSCAVRGLATVREIKDRFHGGLLYIELGNDAGIADIIKGISRIVERTGDVQLAATIRGEKYLQDASDKAAPWFRGRKCLFVVDDIWWVNGITSNVFTILGTMLHDESLLVYTTRDDRFLRGANRIVRFEEKEAHGELARRMLLTHAGFDSDADFSAANRQALTGILDICGGLPLALGIAGSTIWTHQEKREGDKQDVFTDYYRSLQSQEDNIFKGSAENYGPLRLIVDNSIEVLESESSETDRLTKRKIGELFRALCVLKKQQKAYGEMLQKLWDMDSLGETREVAKRMDQVSLVRMRVEGGNVFYVQLHDLVLDIATRKASERYEKKAHFSTLADKYMQKMVDGADLPTAQIENRQLFRAWWTVADDGYIVDNVCRVLEGAGEAEEVLWLLERAQWVVMRLQKYGISGVEDDVRIAEEASRKASTEHGAALKYLDMIRSAARMSCGAVSRNACEAWFQLHGRVAWYAEQCNKTSAFIAEIEHHAPLPWVKAQAGFLLGAGGAALDSFQTTGRSICISHGKELVRFVGADRGGVFVTEYDRRYGNQTRYALVGNKRSEGVTEGAAASSVGEDEAGTERQECYCAAFSKDMKKVITGHEDGSVLVWDIDRGYKLDGRVSMHVDDTDVAAEERRVRGKLDSLRNMCCGMWKSEGTIREAASSRVRSERSAVKCLAVSADGSKIVCGSSDGNVSVRSCGSGAVGDALDALPGGGSVDCVAVSSDARRVVCVQGGGIHVWDGGCGKWLAVPAELENVYVGCAAVSADGERIVCGTEGGAVLVWDVNSSESSVRSMSGHSESVECVALSSDGRVAVSGSFDDTVRVWDADKGEMLGAPLRGHASFVRHVALSADCKEAVSASEGGSVRVWDVQRNVETPHDDERFTTALQCFVYGGHGTRAVFGSRDGCVRLMDVESGRVVGQPLRGHTGAVHVVALSGDGSRIVSASRDDYTVRVWDANSGAAVGAPLTDVDAWCVAVSDDGTRAVAGLSDGAPIVFDTDSGRVIARLRGDTGAVWCCAMSSDGTRVASAGEDGTVRIWDVATSSAVAPPLRGHTDRVMSVAWSADGKRVVSGSDDGTVRVLDVDTAQPVGDALVHGTWVRHVQTDAHGSRVLSIDLHGYGRLWDVTRAECVITSSHRAWAQTVRNFGLARLETRLSSYRDTEIRWRDAAAQEQVLAPPDTPVIRVGDKYFAVEHGPSSVPFCQVQHATHSV